LNENPIRARRGARALARSGCSQDILDYRRSLDIGLKSVGANATRVTFAYTVTGIHSGYITKGDRNTLTREAEAMIALALSRATLSYCPGCGADVVGGARFCRQCGAPAAAAVPLELELLRLTADANASYKNMLTGAILVLTGLLVPALTFLFSSSMSVEKLLKLTGLMVGLVSGPGVVFLLAGIGRLARAIKRRPEQEELPEPSRRGLAVGANSPDTAALPPRSIQDPIQHSVTEATTGLLPQEVKRTNDLN